MDLVPVNMTPNYLHCALISEDCKNYNVDIVVDGKF